MALGDVIARLSVALQLDTAGFERGSKAAQKEVTGLQGHMTKAAKAISTALVGMVSWEAVTMLRDMTRAAIDAAGGLGEQAAALGVTTDALQEYRYAATQVGLEASEMDKAFEQLTRRMGDAKLGVKEPAEALKQLGITLDDLEGKTAGDVIPLIADGMARIEDPATRASIAVDLFGRSGQKLATLLSGGSEEVNNLRQAAHDLGIVLSESEIANADEVADKVAALRYVLEAQQNKKLLENAEALLQYEQAVADLKMGLIDFSNSAGPAFDSLEKGSHRLGKMFFDNITKPFVDMNVKLAATGAIIVMNIGRMVSQIGDWLGNRLNAIFAGVRERIEAVGDWFHDLYMRVVGGSDIPDMVDGIAAEMQRLDAVMVAPVEKATTKAQQAFRDMASDVRDLLGRLFPEIEQAMAFKSDWSLIDKLPEGMRDEAQRRLLRMGDPDERLPVSIANDNIDIVPDMRKVEREIGRLVDRAKDGSVRIAKSFADMAQSVMGSLQRLSGSIRSGDFLGILEGVIGLGLQLGSAGLFGKGVQTRLNSTVPGYAGGTSFHPGGLAMVGERGPELVSMPRGSKVYSNDNTRAMMGGVTVNVHANDAVLTHTVRQWVAEGVAVAIDGGANAAQQRLGFRASRSLR